MSRAAQWLRAGDRWIPALIILGFLIVFAVNGRMVWLAIATHPGMVTDVPPQPSAPQYAVAILYDGAAGQASPVSVRVQDRSGEDVAIATMSLVAVRPSRYAQAVVVELTPAAAAWRGSFNPPIGGEWVLQLSAETEDGAIIEVRRAVDVRPGRLP
jgi:nitrogen fixation protein FixH